MRVLLADDQAKVRSALALLLAEESDMQVVGEIGEAERLLTWVRATHPDLLLLDWELPGLVADHLLGLLHSLCPHMRVIALSGLPEARCAALAAGADAFVSKGDPPERLLTALQVIKEGMSRDEAHNK